MTRVRCIPNFNCGGQTLIPESKSQLKKSQPKDAIRKRIERIPGCRPGEGGGGGGGDS